MFCSSCVTLMVMFVSCQLHCLTCPCLVSTDLKHIDQRAMKLVSLMSEAEKHLSQLQDVVSNGGPLNTIVTTQKVGVLNCLH